MMLFPIKTVLDFQHEQTLLCLKENDNQCWPDDKPNWRRAVDMNDEEYTLHVAFMDQAKLDSVKFHPLNDVKIDDTKAIIQLVESLEEWLLEQGCKPGDRFVLMGEIAHTEGHLVVLRMKDNKLYNMVHDDNFVLVPPAFI